MLNRSAFGFELRAVGANPDVNPYWLLMFDGDVNVVNGTVWPNMDVQRHAYRFRFLNSSNQRGRSISSNVSIA